MKYLFDTNIIIDHIRKKKLIDNTLVREGVGISIITLAELKYGADKSVNPQKTYAAVNNTLKDLDIEIINLREEIIDIYGGIKAELEKKGMRIEDFDLLIAATAIVEDLTLVTRNKTHFERIEKLQILP